MDDWVLRFERSVNMILDNFKMVTLQHNSFLYVAPNGGNFNDFKTKQEQIVSSTHTLTQEPFTHYNQSVSMQI